MLSAHRDTKGRDHQMPRSKLSESGSTGTGTKIPRSRSRELCYVLNECAAFLHRVSRTFLLQGHQTPLRCLDIQIQIQIPTRTQISAPQTTANTYIAAQSTPISFTKPRTSIRCSVLKRRRNKTYAEADADGATPYYLIIGDIWSRKSSWLQIGKK